MHSTPSSARRSQAQRCLRAWGLLGLVLVSCGRTEPWRCQFETQVRPCVDLCGEGVQVCTNFTWSECQVPPIRQPCENVCGSGEAICAGGAVGACEVAPVEVACEDACGSGVALCADGAVGACEVAPVTVACNNDCGEGTAICADGAVGDCEVPGTTLACTNACGEGVAACVNGVIRTCEVPITQVRCEGVCGAGLATCIDGTPGICQTPPVERACMTECGVGVEICEMERWGPCSAGFRRPPLLNVTVRDFLDSHPDFEAFIGTDRGIVEPILGPDDKPVYVGPTTPTTTNRENFDQWYRDVPGVNMTASIELVLTPDPELPELFIFDDQTFFPVDGLLFGNQGRAHNYHFTLEATSEFVYLGGEVFRFRGDDDVWVFINRRLAIDLGGVHGALEASVALDARRIDLGLTLGERYPIHLFFAERQTVGSTFTVETTIADRGDCD